MPNPISNDRIWRDPKIIEWREEKQLVARGIDGGGVPFRLGTAANLLSALEAVREEAIPGFKMPFCIVHGTEDAGVPIEGSDLMW